MWMLLLFFNCLEGGGGGGGVPKKGMLAVFTNALGQVLKHQLFLGHYLFLSSFGKILI